MKLKWKISTDEVTTFDNGVAKKITVYRVLKDGNYVSSFRSMEAAQDMMTCLSIWEIS